MFTSFLRTKKAFLGGLFLVILANIPLYTDQRTVRWDAFDQWWNYFRWMGSSLRQGYFPDFFPHVMSGYPLGADIQAGVYNVFYLFSAYLFPGSILSVNFVYVASQLAIYSTGYAIGRTYELKTLPSAYLGLALTASGFVIGHASHFSYLTSAVGLLGCFLSVRVAVRGRAILSTIIALVSVYHLTTAGYPAVVSFGAQCLLIYWIVTFITQRDRRWSLIAVGSGALGGIVLSLPALYHFLWFIAQTDRGDGLPLEIVLSGSLPTYSLLNLFFPIWGMRYSEPTMERFHLLFISIPLVLYALRNLTKKREKRLTVIVAICVAIPCTLLALGKYDPLGLRQFLGDNFFLYRVGRFPSGEHRGIALFLLALIGAIGLNWLLREPVRYKSALIAFIACDFLVVMYGLRHMRAWQPDLRYRGEVSLYQASLASPEQHILDSPRNCEPDGDYWAGTALREQRDLAPNIFFWNGYVSLRSEKYNGERDANADIVCGPSRLWRADTRVPVSYELRSYEPGRVVFSISDRSLDRDVKLVWSEFNDGLWRLKLNNRFTDFEEFSAGLRSFSARSDDTVEMIYAGPLSRWWRLR